MPCNTAKYGSGMPSAARVAGSRVAVRPRGPAGVGLAVSRLTNGAVAAPFGRMTSRRLACANPGVTTGVVPAS